MDGSGGKGLVVGPDASKETLAALRRTLQADPRGWIAQPVVQLSTIPTLVDEGFRPRHADLRPFAVNDGDDIWVLPGGLTRVALPEGQLVVNSSQGGGSKDTWVLDDGPMSGAMRTLSEQVPASDEVSLATGAISIVSPHQDGTSTPLRSSPLDEDVETRHHQQQQQQQQVGPGAGSC